ncbi:MAG: ribosome small subunit-dependent GTPase A [Lachnospiraceae bacterium]|nr:ribosome small subunit-dependent GTPase A [Lachnospiraceae bacterium]
MRGRIVKGIAGFYYVDTGKNGIYECKAKGIFRKDKQKPLVGDYVELAVLDQETGIGNIEAILPRKNDLIRPNVANVDQALVIFAITRPKPNLNLLDRFLVTMEKAQIESVICFNKKDIASEEEQELLRKSYGQCGYEVHFLSAVLEEGIDELRQLLKGRTTVVAGPSGVGKSSIINLLQPLAGMETGSISEKVDRGKHTTRHSELIRVEEDTYIVDTPGFSSLFMKKLKKEDLRDYYREFIQYEPECRFQGCVHIHEPDCGVKNALEQGKISSLRYENYVTLYEDLKNQKNGF